MKNITTKKSTTKPNYISYENLIKIQKSTFAAFQWITYSQKKSLLNSFFRIKLWCFCFLSLREILRKRKEIKQVKIWSQRWKAKHNCVYQNIRSTVDNIDKTTSCRTQFKWIYTFILASSYIGLKYHHAVDLIWNNPYVCHGDHIHIYAHI